MPKGECLSLLQTYVFIFSQGAWNTGVLDSVCLHYIVRCDTYYVTYLVDIDSLNPDELIGL